jgi:tetratricopeptide (TPR) repeat protein
LHSTAFEPQEAEKAYRQSVEIMDRLVSQFPDDRFYRAHLAWCYHNLGGVLLRVSRIPVAQAAIEKAIKVYESLRSENPDDVGCRNQLAACYRQLSEISGYAGDSERATDFLRREIALLDTLTNEQTADRSRDYRLAQASLLLAQLQVADGPVTQAHQLIQRAVELYGKVAADSPNELVQRFRSADGYTAVATFCTATPGFANEFEDMNSRLSAELPAMLADFPNSRDCEIWVASLYAALGDNLARAARSKEAEAAFRRAMKFYDRHAAQIPVSSFPVNVYTLTSDYLRFAWYLTATHHEEEAAEFVRKADLNATRLTDPIATANALYSLAVAQARLGDKAGYRATCKTLVGLSLQGADELTMSRRIWTPCLAPDALEDPSLPVVFGKEFVANDSYPNRHFALYILGAAHYRAGQFDQAVQRLEESIAAYASDQPRNGFDTINYQQLLIAMAQWQLGNKDQARQLLVKTLPAVEQELQSPSSAWNRRATLELLRSEAESLIGQKEADEAVENIESN